MSSRDRPKRVSPTPATVAQALAYQGTGRRAERDSKSKAKYEGQDPVPHNRPEDNEHKKWNEDGHSVFGDHRLKQLSRESRRPPGRQPWRSSDSHCRQSPTQIRIERNGQAK